MLFKTATGSSRTNAFRSTNPVALKFALAAYGIGVRDTCGRVVLMATDNVWNRDPAALGFSFMEHVMPFVEEGEVVVVAAGESDAPVNLGASAQAYIKDGTGREVRLDMHALTLGAESTFSAISQPARS